MQWVVINTKLSIVLLGVLIEVEQHSLVVNYQKDKKYYLFARMPMVCTAIKNMVKKNLFQKINKFVIKGDRFQRYWKRAVDLSKLNGEITINELHDDLACSYLVYNQD